jgi:phage gp36-like protein
VATRYASAADLTSRFGEAIQQMVSQDPMASTKVQVALEDAAAEVDSYLEGRFQLPLQPVPRTILRVSCDIACYRLLSLLPNMEVEDARHRYEDAVRTLQAIRDARLDLGLPQSSVPASIPMPVLVSSSPRLFSRDTLREG